MEHRYALGVIGTGHIAGVLIRRLIETKYYAADRIIGSNSRALREHSLPIQVADDNRDVVRQADRLMIAVTPQKFAEMAAGIADLITPDHLIISVMAGMSTPTIAAAFAGCKARVVRCMPNLPFGLGHGVTGVFRGEFATQADIEDARHMFAAGGATIELQNESLMDAVTAVAGSGPAYFYYFVEAIMAGGLAAGLPEKDAQTLAAYACMGAGAMLLDRDTSPRELRVAVTSPGGTTEAAMNVLQSGHVMELMTEAVLAAARRGRELGRKHQSGSPAGRDSSTNPVPAGQT